MVQQLRTLYQQPFNTYHHHHHHPVSAAILKRNLLKGVYGVNLPWHVRDNLAIMTANEGLIRLIIILRTYFGVDIPAHCDYFL